MAGGEDLPKGSVEFSILDEGTHIKPHCGPSNHKWRFHLGVIVPDNGSTSIRVGDPLADAARRPWQEGKVLLFDDSYEHEVFHEGLGQGPRVVLIVDVYDCCSSIHCCTANRSTHSRRMRAQHGVPDLLYCVVRVSSRWHPQIQSKSAREQIRRDFAWHSARDSLVRSGLV